MKKNLMFILPVGTLLLAGCEVDDSTQAMSKGKIIDMAFYAGRPPAVSHANTRTVMDRFGAITWEDNDAICVNGVESSTNANPAGEYARFPITLPQDETYHALYPASLMGSGSSFNNGVYTIHLPNVQPWKDNVSFNSGVNPSVAYSTTADLSFYNLCGILKFSMKKADGYDDFQAGGVRYVTADGTEYVCGKAMVSPKNKTIMITGGSGASDRVLVDYMGSSVTPQAISKTSVANYIVLPPGTYAAGSKIQLLDAHRANVLSEVFIEREVNIHRSGITNLGVIPIEPTSSRLICLDDNGTPNPSDDKLVFPPIGDRTNKGLFFKFGSVVGVHTRETNDEFDAGDVVFNPSMTYTPSDNWAEIPNISELGSDVFHTVDSLKAGKGDPCRLVGYTIGEIQAKLGRGELPDNKKYRLPTKEELPAYAATHGSFDGTKRGMTFTSGNFFLPAVASREWKRGGQTIDQGFYAYYWTSTRKNAKNAYMFYFNYGNAVYTENATGIPNGLTVRCVSQ